MGMYHSPTPPLVLRFDMTFLGSLFMFFEGKGMNLSHSQAIPFPLLPFQPLHGHSQCLVQLVDHPAARGVHGQGAGGGREVLAMAAILQLVLHLGWQDSVVVLGHGLLAALLGCVGCQGELRPPDGHTDQDFLWR